MEEQGISTGAILLITAIIIALIAALPRWPYSTAWGYRPARIISALLVIVSVLFLFGVW